MFCSSRSLHSTATSDYHNDKKGLLEQGALDETLSCSSYFTVAPFHAHVVEKT